MEIGEDLIRYVGRQAGRFVFGQSGPLRFPRRCESLSGQELSCEQGKFTSLTSGPRRYSFSMAGVHLT